MIGGLQGQWALLLVVYAGLVMLAIAAHIVWAWRVGGVVWRSRRSFLSRIALIALVVATPVIGFYIGEVLKGGSRPAPHPGLGMMSRGFRMLAMPAVGLGAVIVSAVQETWRYSPDFRTMATALGFLPGMLLFYVATVAILFMTASVSGLSRSGFLASRTHLVSALLMLTVLVVMR